MGPSEDPPEGRWGLDTPPGDTLIPMVQMQKLRLWELLMTQGQGLPPQPASKPISFLQNPPALSRGQLLELVTCTVTALGG